MKRSNSNSTHPSGTNNNSNNNSNSEAIYTQRNKEKMVTQVTMALKYVHLMEMFEAFIMSFQDVSNRRRIELLRAFNRMGFDSENMRRKVMSRAGLSGRNEYNRPVPKVFEDVIKTAAAWFRRSHPYLAIQVRTKKTGNGRHIHLCFGYRMNAIKGRFNELFVEQNRFSRPYHGYVPIVAILVAKRGRLFIDELRLGDFGGDAMEVTEDYYLRLYDGLLTPSNVHNRRHRKIIRMASDIHDRGGTAWFRKQNWKTGFGSFGRIDSLSHLANLYRQGNILQDMSLQNLNNNVKQARNRAKATDARKKAVRGVKMSTKPKKRKPRQRTTGQTNRKRSRA